MQKRLTISRGVKILDQKKPEGVWVQRTHPPAGLRVKLINSEGILAEYCYPARTRQGELPKHRENVLDTEKVSITKGISVARQKDFDFDS